MPSQTEAYRLRRYQLLNWGTFNNQIFTLAPEGEATLLTGQNGAGKTVLIDGLQMLLIPRVRDKQLNMAGGKESARTEESYVLGEYGQEDDPDTRGSRAQRLRGHRQSHSVLLAEFASANRCLTLAQVRWFSNNQLKRYFIIAETGLSIEKHFAELDSEGEWKKHLKIDIQALTGRGAAYAGDAPGEYGIVMRRLMGMRSEKASTLFGQTIGLKNVGDLSKFIQDQMLEERDAEAQFLDVLSHFKSLTDTHRSIQRIEAQIELLLPIRTANLAYTQALQRKQQAVDEQHQGGRVFHYLAMQTATRKAEELYGQKASFEQQTDALADRKAQAQADRDDLKAAIDQNDKARRLADIDRGLQEAEHQKVEARRKLEAYNELAAKAGLRGNPSADSFMADLHQREQLQQMLEARLHEIDEQTLRKRLQQDPIVGQIRQLERDLADLRGKQRNITGRLAEVRREAAEALGIADTDLPFVGELVRVRDEEKAWEPALEKLLRGFAQQLLVEERHYLALTSYVNQNNLRTLLIYNRAQARPVPGYTPMADTVPGKLQTKPKAKLAGWVIERLQRDFDHRCTEDEHTFAHAGGRAITLNGLIKNNEQHRKDDRPQASNRKDYVLGWDNMDKLSALEQELAKVRVEAEDIANSLKSLEQERTNVLLRRDAFSTLVSFDRYVDIDWQTPSARMAALSHERDEIQASNADLRAQRARLAELEKQVKALEQQEKDLHKRIGGLEEELKKAHYARDSYDAELGDEPMDEKAIATFRERHAELAVLAFERLAQQGAALTRALQTNARVAETHAQEATQKLERAMHAYLHPRPSLVQQFPEWELEQLNLSAVASFADDFELLLKQKKGEELAGQQAEFKRLLNQDVVMRIAGFEQWLLGWEREIKENIAALNTSLKAICFRQNPDTFIQIDHSRAPGLYRDFLTRLAACKENAVTFGDEKEQDKLELNFTRIKELLDGLSANRTERDRLLDVRNWLTFKAKEIAQHDGSVRRTYAGTQSLSGGEGAQLTYTILGSAIAYQFGITDGGAFSRSFRFICVDEAFSKQDSEKAVFLMNLCRQLDLQIMVVSPAKAEEVQIVEPYIRAVHLVQRNLAKGPHSVVWDMPIAEFKVRRAEYIPEQEAAS